MCRRRPAPAPLCHSAGRDAERPIQRPTAGVRLDSTVAVAPRFVIHCWVVVAEAAGDDGKSVLGAELVDDRQTVICAWITEADR